MLEEYTMEETKQQQGRSPDSLIQAIDRIERLEKKNEVLGERILSMIDLLQKCYFYLSVAEKCKLTFDHIDNIRILMDFINQELRTISELKEL